MTKLTDILKEIKINNPTDVFRVTDTGKQAYYDYHSLVKILDRYIENEDYIELMLSLGVKENQTNQTMLNLLNFSVVEDERILNLNDTNKISEFIEKGERIMGWSESEARALISEFKKEGWIK
jgi:hypothetical protein